MVYLTSGLQYINGVWTLIKEWYVYLEDIGWKSNKFYIVNNGVWSFRSLPSGWTQTSVDVQKKVGPLGDSAGSVSYTTNHFNVGQYSYIHVDQKNSGGNYEANVVYTIAVENKVLLNQQIGNPVGTTKTYIVDLPITSNDNYGKITCSQAIHAKNSGTMWLYNIYVY